MRKTVRRMAAAAMVFAVSGTGDAAPANEVSPPHERLSLTSVTLHEVRRLNVYLPPSYDADPTARYPVLYMLDGGEAEDFPHLARAADRLIREGAVRAFLIVGVENTDRRRDMTSPTQDAEDLKVTSSPGGAPSLRRFFASELRPAVLARYRVSHESAVIGESLAGLFVVDTLLKEPDLFDTYVAIDPSLWWNRRASIRAVPTLDTRWPGRETRLLLTAGGDQSNKPEVEAFVEALSKAKLAGLAWRYTPRPGLRHDNIYRGAEEALLLAVFPAGRQHDQNGRATTWSGPVTRYEGRCQCGEVTFCVDADIVELTTCDCSLCARRNALMAIVPETALVVLSGKDRLTCYTWNTALAKHYFCSICGVYLFHRKRAMQKHFSINVFCLDRFDWRVLPVRATDGVGMRRGRRGRKATLVRPSRVQLKRSHYYGTRAYCVAMELHTDRLMLRRFTLADAPAFAALVCDPEIVRYTGEQPAGSDEEVRSMLAGKPLRDYELYGYGRSACIERATGELVGFCGLKYLEHMKETDLGYRFLPRCWGKGYATEAAASVLDWGANILGFSRIIGLVDPRNTGSVRVLEKLGFRLEVRASRADAVRPEDVYAWASKLNAPL